LPGGIGEHFVEDELHILVKGCRCVKRTPQEIVLKSYKEKKEWECAVLCCQKELLFERLGVMRDISASNQDGQLAMSSHFSEAGLQDLGLVCNSSANKECSLKLDCTLCRRFAVLEDVIYFSNTCGALKIM